MNSKTQEEKPKQINTTSMELREKLIEVVKTTYLGITSIRIVTLLISIFILHNNNLTQTCMVSICAYIAFFIITHSKKYYEFYYLNFYLMHLEVCFFTYNFISSCGFGYGFEIQIIIMLALSYFTSTQNKFLSYLLFVLEATLFIYMYVAFGADYKIHDYLKPICFVSNIVLISLVFYKIQDAFKIGKFLKAMTSANQRKYFESKSSNDKLTETLNIYSFRELIVIKFLSNDTVIINNISFIAINIQDFKSINDKHGYEVGDEILKIFAKTLKNNCENDQLIARIGGDKFIIAIFNEDEEYVKKLAYAIKDSTKMNQFTRYKVELKLNVGISFANFPDFEQINNIIQESLQNMERCKSKQEFMHFSIYKDLSGTESMGGGNYGF